jgi:hypothetical protein
LRTQPAASPSTLVVADALAVVAEGPPDLAVDGSVPDSQAAARAARHVSANAETSRVRVVAFITGKGA